jgi:hypothetical protein
MKLTEIEIGGRYIAKVSGQLTTVRVLAIRETTTWRGDRTQKRIDVVNERTGRKTTFASAAKLRRAVGSASGNGKEKRPALPPSESPDPVPDAILHAAQDLLGARQDQMLTVDEWIALARAVAMRTGRKTADLLTPRDFEDARRYEVIWDESVDGPLPESEG